MKNSIKVFGLVLICVLSTAYGARASTSIQVNCSGSDSIVSIIITDENGKKVGFDPRTKIYYRELGGAGTESLGVIGVNELEVATSVAMVFEPFNNKYTIEIIGKEGLTEYHVDFGISYGPKKFLKLSTEGITDKFKVSTFVLNYNEDNPSEMVLKRTSTQSSLIQDIKLSRKMEWIDSDGIVKSLIKKAEASIASEGRGRHNSASNELEALIKEVKAQRGKHINEKAATIITEDAQYLIDNL